MESAVVASNNFNLKLLLVYRSIQEHGNMLYSPFNIASSLAVLSGGAKGNTKKEIVGALRIEGMRDVEEQFGGVSKSIKVSNPANVVLDSVTALVLQNNYTVLPEFANIVEENYKANLVLLDFQNKGKETAKEINHLIQIATHNKIQDVLPSYAITEDTKLILANAIYFKGKWEAPLKPSNTEKKPFFTVSKQEVMVDMMHREGDYRCTYYSDLQASFLEIPYSGRKFSMIVILPEMRYGLPLVENSITIEKLNDALRRMKIKHADLFLPKFKLEESIPLKECLSDMGVKEAFGYDADFSGISKLKCLNVSEAFHHAFLEVNEEGAEVADAIEFKMKYMSSDFYFDFVVDHPFMFFVRDTNTGLVLFTGSVHTL